MRIFAIGLCCIVATLCPATAMDLISDLKFFDVRNGKSISLGPINSETVAGFELLYATPGTGDIAEIAGHLLLRVKLRNNPQAAEAGTENPHDLVISFLADTESEKQKMTPRLPTVQETCRDRNWFNLVVNHPSEDESPLTSLWQSLRGLSGGFKIIMDLQTLGHTVKAYTVEQDRNLLRYSLNMDEQMKANLIDHLIYVQKHYQPPYYFFSQNCGSVLVKVIGQGLGDEDIAHFDPFVSPPHTLIGNLLRKGLATPITPSFYSFRKGGFIAQEIFVEQYNALANQFPQFNWPSHKLFAHRNEFVRANALQTLGRLAQEQADLREGIFYLVSWAQEAELVYAYKDLYCEDYTSAATTESRQIQRQLQADNQASPSYAIDTHTLLRNHYAPIEQEALKQGSAHTQHFTWSLGIGALEDRENKSAAIYSFEGALLKQDMGSTSRIAMQRGSAVELGGVSLVADQGQLREWRLTGLRLQKFRDTLDRVSSCIPSTRGLGLSLSVLDFQHRELSTKTRGVIAGLAGLGNLASTAHHNDFLFFSLGSELTYREYDNHKNIGIDIPLRAESLFSLGAWQWRSVAQVALSTRSDNGHELEFNTSLAIPLGDFWASEMKLRVSLNHQRVFSGDIVSEDEDRLLGQIQVEINRW